MSLYSWRLSWTHYPFVFLRNTPDDPFLNQNHWTALNATFSLTANPQLTPRPPKNEMKNEKCRQIIKVPLHGHETFGAIHTIQYRCIRYCSRCRRRGYYNGLNRAWNLFQASGTWKGSGFYSWSIWKGPKWDQSQIDFMDVRDKKTCFSYLFIL